MEQHNGVRSLPLPGAEPPDGLWPELVVHGWERIHNHAVSPDGRRVAFYWDRNGCSDLWVAPLDQPAFPQRLTFERPYANWWEDEPPVWSPDSQWLVYGVYEGEPGSRQVSNLHVVAAGGSMPRSLTELHYDAAEPSFSPDGSRIAFCTHKGDATQIAMVPFEGGWVLGLTQGDQECGAPAWSPDGRRIVYHASTQHARRQLGVFGLPAGGGPPDQLTPADSSEYWAPSYAPDGSAIALLCNRSGYDELWIMSPDGSRLRQLSHLCQDIEDYTWSPDGARIAVISSVHGDDRIQVIRVVDGAAQPAPARSGNYAIPRWVHGREAIVVGHDSPATPPDVYLLELDGSRMAPLTNASAPALRNYGFVAPRYVEYTSFDGWVIPAFLYPPGCRPKDDRGAPAIVYPHGGPTAEYDVHWDPIRQYFVAKGYAVLCPNYRGSTGYGRAFKEGNLYNWGVGDLKDCLSGADMLADQPGIDRDRLAIWGQSYGGYLAQLALARDADYRFRCGVSLYGDSHLKTSWASGDHSGRQDVEWQMGMPGPQRARYESSSPLNWAAHIHAPLLLIHGERDPRVAVTESRQMVDALRRLDKTFEYKTYADEGHGFARPANALDALRTIERFLDWHLL